MEQQYTSGELARLCNVSVRAVQFYDKQGLLKPHGYSEGNRRLYGEEELGALRLILSYKSLGLSLSEIRTIMQSENRAAFLGEFIAAKRRSAEREIEEANGRLKKLRLLEACIRDGKLSDDTVVGLSHIVNKRALRKTHAVMLAFGIVSDLIQIAGIVLSVVFQTWLYYVLALIPMVIICTLLTVYYLRSAKFMCPECGQIFPMGWRTAFSRHGIKTRRLQCPHCKKISDCREIPSKYVK